MENLSIFECLYPKYQVTKPIRLIELFAGYGSQALALKYLGVPFEHYGITEWNYKSIEAYRAIHYPGCEDTYKDKLNGMPNAIDNMLNAWEKENEQLADLCR